MIMNKKGFLKVLIMSLVMLTTMGLLASRAMASLAQADPNNPYAAPYIGLWQLYDGALTASGVTSGILTGVSTQEMMQVNGQPALGGKFVPTPIGPTFLLDNFQYWKDARSMGWSVEEPDYPVYGAGIGYGNLQTVIDFEEGSRVLDVNRAASVFLPFNNPQLTPYRISKFLDTKNAFMALTGSASAPCLTIPCFPSCTGTPYCGLPLPGLYNQMSFKVRAPLAIEQFDTFRMQVNVILTDGTCASIVLWPRDKYTGCADFGAASVEPPAGGYVPVPPPSRSVIDVFVGRQFADGTWHLVMVDLDQVVQNYTRDNSCGGGNCGAPQAGLLAIVGVEVSGNVYRLDDIMFTIGANSLAQNHAPYLFRIGPVYATLFGESANCPPGMLPSTCTTRYVFAEDQDLNMQMERNATTGALIFPNMYDAVSGVQHGQTGFDPNNAMIVDVPAANMVNGRTPTTLPPAVVLANRQTPAKADLQFIVNMESSLGPQVNSSLATPVSAVEALQSIPYLPSWETPMNEWVQNTGTASASTNPMLLLVKALVNCGYVRNGAPYIPGILRLNPARGQVLEDMILCCRVVDNAGLSDQETFPVSVVNYAVTNLPPLLEQLEDQFFQTNVVNTYQITATDPDLQDMGLLTYKATLDGLPSYQYGPWINSIINPITGTVSFTPQFEGALTCIVTVSDPRGMSAVGHFTIFCVNGGGAGGGWYNHSPIVTRVIQSPQEVVAGRLFVLTDLNMADPDNQPLYYSCNVGAVGVDGIYTFQSEFPGEYLVQITGYDPLGGAVTQQFVLNVMPFWSI
jgi:hypothetical protein